MLIKPALRNGPSSSCDNEAIIFSSSRDSRTASSPQGSTPAPEPTENPSNPSTDPFAPLIAARLVPAAAVWIVQVTEKVAFRSENPEITLKSQGPPVRIQTPVESIEFRISFERIGI
jgi:hypothetical protein